MQTVLIVLQTAGEQIPRKQDPFIEAFCSRLQVLRDIHSHHIGIGQAILRTQLLQGISIQTQIINAVKIALTTVRFSLQSQPFCAILGKKGKDWCYV